MFLVLGALVVGGLAITVYANPSLIVNEEKTPAVTHLKTAGTSVMSVMIENQWKALYRQQKGVQVDYESTGSSAGIQKMIQKGVSVAFTHAPISPEQQRKAKEAGGEVIQVPIVVCSVVAIYHVKELKGKKPLNVTGEVLANIFLGKIQNWNHPDLKAINPELASVLPSTPIKVIHRKDSSGTTQIFTDYLFKSSPSWKEKFPNGGASDVNWPVGVGAERNMNLAVQVSQTDGAIGYVDFLYSHIEELEFDHAAVENADKSAFLRPNMESMAEAAKAAVPGLRPDLSLDVANKPGAKSYPISGVIYAICYRNLPDPTRTDVVDFLHWATHEGQKYTEKMSYTAIPSELSGRIEQQLNLIKPAP